MRLPECLRARVVWLRAGWVRNQYPQSIRYLILAGDAIFAAAVYGEQR